MSHLKDIITEKPITGYFILDSKAEGKGGGEYEKEVNFDFYLYKTRFFKKLVPDALFLYRLPGGAAVDRKFSFYGGGRIKSISEPDENGNVRATITEGFRFTEPLRQGDPKLESVVWTSRTRKPVGGDPSKLSWEHVFSQYGMNAITEDEFWAIVKDLNCVAAEKYKAGKSKGLSPEEEILDEVPAADYTLELSEPSAAGKAKRGRRKKVTVGRHIDYNALQAKKNKIGELGELIVYNYVCDQNSAAGIERKPVHVSKDEGDGLGYDIRSWNKEGIEVHIEVKATRGNTKDGFRITPAEVEASKAEGCIYQIYRIYDLDPVKGTAKLCIYDGPINEQKFALVPTEYEVYLK